VSKSCTSNSGFEKEGKNDGQANSGREQEGNGSSQLDRSQQRLPSTPRHVSSRKAPAYPQKETAPRFARGDFQPALAYLAGPFLHVFAYPQGFLWRLPHIGSLNRTLESFFSVSDGNIAGGLLQVS
jgi:hypothetical protein